MLLSIFHAGKRLLGNVRLLAEANLLGHLRNMDRLESLGGQSADHRDLFLEGCQPPLLARSNLRKLLESHPIEGDLHSVHGLAQFLEAALDFIRVKLVYRGHSPLLFELIQLSVGLPEVIVGLDLLLAHIELRELLDGEIKILLLLVDELLLLSHLPQFLL